MIQYGSDEELLCPACGFPCTHVDNVHVAARGEDGPFNEITVNAVSGQINTHGVMPAPMGDRQSTGRRHRIALIGRCESGCDFAIVFTQHKGATYIETVPAGPWRSS